jgi:hypothetical protein
MLGNNAALLGLYNIVTADLQRQPNNFDLQYTAWGLAAELDNNLLAAVSFYEKSNHHLASMRYHQIIRCYPVMQPAVQLPIFAPNLTAQQPAQTVQNIRHLSPSIQVGPNYILPVPIPAVVENVAPVKKPFTPEIELDDFDFKVIRTLHQLTSTHRDCQKIYVAQLLGISSTKLDKIAKNLRLCGLISRWPSFTPEGFSFIKTHGLDKPEEIEWDLKRNKRAPILHLKELQKEKAKKARTDEAKAIPDDAEIVVDEARPNMLRITSILN